MNKTTSFSKIKNNIIKNDLILFNNTVSSSSSTSSSSQVASNRHSLQPPQSSQQSFFIDSINEKNRNNTATAATLAANNNSYDRTNLLFEPAPVDLFADSYNAPQCQYRGHEQPLISTVDSIQFNGQQQHCQQQSSQKLKHWSSESNLIKTKKRLNKLNKSCINPNEEQTNDATPAGVSTESYYDYDLDDENDDPLQFSDHAGLFDDTNGYASNTALNQNNSNSQEDSASCSNTQMESSSNIRLLNNYDVYKAAKQNYKLAYNTDHTELFALSKSGKKTRRNNNTNGYSIRNYQTNGNNDSLINSEMTQSTNLNESRNYYDDDDDEDEDNEEAQEEEHEEEGDVEYGENSNNEEPYQYNVRHHNDYYYYLNKLANSDAQYNHQAASNESAAAAADLFSSSMVSNDQLNDSIMNWSMKISNYNFNSNQQQHYHQQKLQYQMNASSKRSPPIPLSPHHLPRSNSSFSKLYFNNLSAVNRVTAAGAGARLNSNEAQQQHYQLQQQQSTMKIKPLSNKSTTSWGKLKHSKSSSSNMGVTHSFNAHDTSSSGGNNYENDDSKEINLLESVHVQQQQQFQQQQHNESKVNLNQLSQDSASPSLFRLFQYSKATLSANNKTFEELNSSSEANSYACSSSSSRSNRRNEHLTNQAITHFENQNHHHNQQQQQSTQKQQTLTKTTSFSQLRQRSLSSCALVNNQETNQTSTANNTNYQFNNQTASNNYNHNNNNNNNAFYSNNNANNTTPNLVVVVDTNSKKSVGIQHDPHNRRYDLHEHDPIQASTIVCMLVDRNNSKTSKELIEVAARAARAAVAARRTQMNQFSIKSSLPDLTFLKEYGDDTATRSNTISNENQSSPNSTHYPDEHQQQQQFQPSANNLKNSLSSANLIKPISDLIKLDELSIKKTVMNGQQQSQQQLQITGSELLKRKTLKSIKRYRQTKQNTEPCNLITEDPSVQCISNHSNQLQQQYQQSMPQQEQKNQQKASHTTGYLNSPSSSTSSSSGHTNTSGYASNLTDKHHPPKQPLKSCLKRKDSSSSTSQTTSPATNGTVSSNKQSKLNPTSSLIVKQTHQPTYAVSAASRPSSTQMFVPFVGYLYTWDKDSTTRYVYYNNLERTRRIKAYRQLIKRPHSIYDEEDDDDEEDEEELCSQQATKPESEPKKQLQHTSPQVVSTSRSYNDLRVKKSVTFLAHLIENSAKKFKTNSLSPSTTIETTATLSTSSSSSSTATAKENSPFTPKIPTTATKSNAPLLQYDALIAMLKSTSIQQQQQHQQQQQQQKQKQEQTKSAKQSPPLMSKLSRKNSLNKTSSFKIERQNSNTSNNNKNNTNSNENYFKKSQIIDADSISLASLSESPPSEFKFSDDDDYDVNKLDETLSKAIKLNQQANANKSFAISNLHINTTSSSSSASSTASSSISSNNLINYSRGQRSNTVSSHLTKQQQQMKLNQAELIRNKKKNFHSILLKDTKLNNLKEILLEIREQQQRLIYLANESKQKKESATFLDTGNQNVTVASLRPSSSSSTLNQTSIIAINPSDSTVSIELKDTIEKLSQFLFEFLKQGLKPVSFETLSSNLTSSSHKTPVSPSLVERALPDSSSLTLAYSQYTQLWNLIENSININLAEQQNEIFKLPKEAYLNMFQEINSYSNNTNQTYLIDSGINTSQLRRKHHFMVNLMSLKFKFQLFIINLLNYKQLANWLDHLNRDKGALKKYYDLKLLSSNSNNSGDSGVGDFICMSASSSSSSSLSASQNNTHLNNNVGLTHNGYNLIASLSLTSLANVSIFENEEYFSYFYKLIQQFNFIEFNLKISKEKPEIKQSQSQPKITQAPSTPRKTSLSRRNSNNLLQTHYNPLSQISPTQPTQPQQHQQPFTKPPSMTSSPSAPISNISFNSNNNNTTNGNTGSHSVFNLKSISKRLNIKSWFSSSQQQQQQQSTSTDTRHNSTLPSMSSNNLKNGSNILKQKSSTQISATSTASSSSSNNNSSSNIKTVGKASKSKGPLSKILYSSSLMKHSLSEPSLNELME